MRPIPAKADMPIITTAAAWEEMAVAFDWHLLPTDYYHLPRWTRAALLAYNRLRARLDYWSGEWARGRQLPAVTVTRG